MENVKEKISFRDLRRTSMVSLSRTYSEFEEATKGSVSGNYTVQTERQFDDLFISYELTDFQKLVLGKLYPVFDFISCLIEPEKLKYTHSVNADQDLIFSRKTDKGLSTLIIHDDELIVYSFISSVSKEGDIFNPFYDVDNVDFESLVYKFFI